MVLSILCLLPGCGSDSTPKEAKKEKTAKGAGVKDMRTITSLLTDKEGKTPQVQQSEGNPFNLTLEEMEAKRKAAEKAMLDPKREVFQGLTVEQLDAKKEAARRVDPKREVFPGMTLDQYNAKLIEGQQRQASNEILPGITMEQMKAKAAEAKQHQEAQGKSPEQVFQPKAQQSGK